MNQQYLRDVVVDIFLPNQASFSIRSASAGAGNPGLRIAFECEKKLDSKPNTGKIQIYNLSEINRAKLETKNIRARVAIGYEGLIPRGLLGTGIFSTRDVPTVFIGSVSKVVHKVENPDILTELELGDGLNRYRNTYLDKGYPPGVTNKQIYNDLFDSLGLGRPNIDSVKTRKFANGFSVSGNTWHHLNILTKSDGVSWSIQDERIQILSPNQVTNTGLILISPQTGLIGSPNRTKEGIEFKALANPYLLPGKKVKLESRFIVGYFKICKVDHSVDSHYDDSTSSCEATRIG